MRDNFLCLSLFVMQMKARSGLTLIEENVRSNINSVSRLAPFVYTDSVLRATSNRHRLKWHCIRTCFECRIPSFLLAALGRRNVFCFADGVMGSPYCHLMTLTNATGPNIFLFDGIRCQDLQEGLFQYFTDNGAVALYAAQRCLHTPCHETDKEDDGA